MTNNKSIKIELGGHTDSDGDIDENKILSEKRAKSAVDYLINKGIDKTRLTYKGYGESNPKVENNSLENKSINRRTEVKIIGA
jgi:outer membrane protein OmpA-like peptidoglycan-associated protein